MARDVTRLIGRGSSRRGVVVSLARSGRPLEEAPRVFVVVLSLLVGRTLEEGRGPCLVGVTLAWGWHCVLEGP